MKQELTIREMGDRLREAFKGIPQEQRANSFERMMDLARTPVGELKKPVRSQGKTFSPPCFVSPFRDGGRLRGFIQRLGCVRPRQDRYRTKVN
jgi:hypothetical protein